MIQDLEFDIDLKHKTICKECCKQNDTLNLIFNVYDNGQAVDLTGFTAILNCNINNTNQVIKNNDITISDNKITVFDKDKYITTLGENATLEIVLSKDDIQKTSFNISLEVDKSIMNTTGHLEEVVITALANLQEDLNKASATVQKLEEENTKANNNTNSLSTENTRSETNYNNLKNINNNLSDLLEANSTAETNINNLITENNKATANIEAMQKLGDVTNLAQQVETNKENITEITTQLNAKVNNFYKIFYNLNGKHIKFLGDSIAGGTGGTGCSYTGEDIGTTTGKKANNNGTCWVNSFRKYLESKYNCVTKNWGVGGWKSSDIVAYLSELIEETDDIIICAIGANNCYVDNGLTQLKSDIRTINKYCINNRKKIIYIGTIQTLSCSHETLGIKMEDIDNCLREVTTELNEIFVPMYKLFEDYILSCGYDSNLLYYNEAHPNDNGYMVMYYLISNYLGFYTDLDNRKTLLKIYDTGWIDVPLQEGITIDGILTPQYRRVGNNIQIRGSVKGIKGNETLIGVLPVGFRPSGQAHYINSIMSGFYNASVRIDTNGKIYYQGNQTNSISETNWVILTTNFQLN